MAMAKPEVMATQLVAAPPLPPPVCAKAAGASRQTASKATSSTTCNFLIVDSFLLAL